MPFTKSADLFLKESAVKQKHTKIPSNQGLPNVGESIISKKHEDSQ